MSNHPPSTPHILRIPGELRNQIYADLLVVAHPICIYRRAPAPAPNNDIDHDNDTPQQHQQAPSLSTTLTSLFLTCRQVHLEASAIFYAHNKFTLPSHASRAPRQLQANLLFRFFLDRLGPRNTAFLRHLAVPFPVDPDELFRAHLNSAPAYQNGGRADDGECCRSLVPALRARCPALETVELDAGGNTRWLRSLSRNPETVRVMFGRLDEGLRAAFPGLRRVDLRLGGPGRKGRFDEEESALGPTGAVKSEWEWVREIVEDGLGWRVTAVEEHRRDAPADVSSWTLMWHPDNPRHPSYLLYGPPEMALQSEIHDQWTKRDQLKAYAGFAIAFARSPTKAIREWREAHEWREWKRSMIAQAGPVGIPLYCFGTGSSSSTPARALMRESFKRGVRGFLTSRRQAD